MTRIDPISAPHPIVVPSAGRRAVMRDLFELTKPGITRMVTITAAVGFAMGAMSAAAIGLRVETLLLTAIAAIAGAALSSAGASALNEWAERRRDGLMSRTASRPIPSGRLSPGAGLVTGLTLAIVGVAVLAAFVNTAAAAVSAITILAYLLLYTPLKPVTPLATLIGAVPGALPPLIGWAAAFGADSGASRGLLHPGGWSIFLLMFVWQIPHFLAIAWWRRDDYARGGHRVLTVVDPTGARASWTVLVWSVALIPVSLSPAQAMPGLLGWPYVIVATALGLLFLAAAVGLAVRRTQADARRVFFASIAYLPLVLAAMVADGALAGLLGSR